MPSKTPSTKRTMLSISPAMAGRSCIGIALLFPACYQVAPGRLAVESVEIRENDALRESEILKRLATAPSPKFLGIWDGVAFEYEYYDRFVLQRDLDRLERFYRAEGYYETRVRAARVLPTGQDRVRVEIVVDEGPPVHVKSVTPQGLESVPFLHQAAVLEAIEAGLEPGDLFSESEYEASKLSIEASLHDRGFAWASVRGDVQVNLISHEAAIRYTVEAGPAFVIRTVRFEGLGDDIPEDKIRRVFNVQSGDVFSARELELGKVSLLDLGVLADVQVAWPRGEQNTNTANEKADTNKSVVPRDTKGNPAIDVVVNCTPAPLRTVKLGIGMELDIIRSDVHAVASWESRNFLGGLRKLSVSAKPGLVLIPTRVGNLVQPELALPEARVQSELRQPGFIEPRAAGIVRGNVAIYPVLLQTDATDVVLGYRDLRGALGLERPFWGNRVLAALFGHGQAYYPFTYVGPLDDDLREVFIRYLDLFTHLDLRDNSVRPHAGAFLSHSLQLAGGALGGSVSDVKLQPELRLYAPVSSSVTFAVRGTIGLLFPRDYGSSLNAIAEDGDTRDQQLVYFRAFFSGGPSSNRGYPYRGVGPRGPGGFLAPNMTATQFQQACSGEFANEASCMVPLGGLTLWESSAEVRFPVFGPVSGAVFADASDVTREQATFHFEYLHLSTGMGVRYDTPVGPIRLDVGYRVPGLQKLGEDLTPEEGDPGLLWGVPMAISFAVGESF